MEKEIIEFNSNDWRARFIIKTSAVFHEDDYFKIENCVIKIVALRERGVFLLDMYINKDSFDDHNSLYDYSVDKMNEFVSQLSAITFSAASILKFISICPIKVNKGEEFTMILSDFNFDRSNTLVLGSDLMNLNSEKEKDIEKYNGLLYMLREAINSQSYEQKFLNYFAALDAIATIETTEKVKNTCKKCGHESEGMPATSNYLKQLFLSHNIKNSEYNKIRVLRGKIAHGGGKRNQEFYKELRKFMPLLESVSFSEVTKKIGIVPKLSTNLTFEPPIWHIVGKKTSNKIWFIPPMFKIIKHELKGKINFSILKNAISQPQNIENFEGSFGIDNPQRPNINRDSWPY